MKFIPPQPPECDPAVKSYLSAVFREIQNLSTSLPKQEVRITNLSGGGTVLVVDNALGAVVLNNPGSQLTVKVFPHSLELYGVDMKDAAVLIVRR